MYTNAYKTSWTPPCEMPVGVLGCPMDTLNQHSGPHLPSCDRELTEVPEFTFFFPVYSEPLCSTLTLSGRSENKTESGSS